MKKSIFLFFAAILCAIGMNATTWTVAGDKEIVNGTTAWKQDETKNDLTNVSGTKWGLLVENKTLSKKSYYFKITKDHKWDTSYPGSNYDFKIGAAGTYNIIYRFNTSGNSVEADYFQTWTVAGSGTVLTDEWTPGATANDMTRNGNTFEYVLTKKNVKLTAGTNYECKVCKDHAWGTEYPSQNKAFSVSTTGNYDVIFTFNVATTDVTVTTTPVYTITASANPATAGTITGAGTYAKDASVTLEATPNAGYKFVNWTVGGVEKSTETTYSFTASADVTAVANFELSDPEVPIYAISVSANDDAMGTVTGAGDYTEGSPVTLTATPNAGYRFVNWTVGSEVKSTEATYSFTASEALTIVANFEAIPKYDITVKAVVPEAWTSTTIGIHYWGDGISGTDTPVATEKDGNWNKYTIKDVLEGQSVNVIFLNGTSWGSDKSKQTANIMDITEDKCFQISAKTLDGEGKCTVTEVDCAADIKPEGDVYTVVGSSDELGLAWDPTKKANDMEKQIDGSYKKVYSNVELTTSVEWKIAKNGAWWNETPLENKAANGNSVLTISKSGIYNVTFTLSKDLKTAHAEAELLEETNTVADCFVSGNAALTGGAGWAGNEFKMEYDPATETYSYTLTGLAAETAYELQVVLGGNWYGYEELQTIPTGVENKEGHIAFTLADAGDVVVTYNVENGITLTGNFAVPTPATYTVVGHKDILGESWNLASTINIMTETDGNYTLTKTGLKLEARDYEYKVVKNGAYGEGEYPNGTNEKVTIAENGVYTIVYTYKVGTSLEAVATKTGDYTPDKATYTVAGDIALCGTNWKADDETNDMTDNGDGTFTWAKTGIELVTNVSFKVVKNHDFENESYPSENWVIDIEGSNGVYDITITFTESNKEIKVEKTRTGDLPMKTLVYTVTVPAGTKQCYIAGGMNVWTAQPMTPAGTNKFSISIDNVTIATEYKYTCKDGDDTWAYVEKKNGNVNVEDRTYNANDVVERWNRIDISDGENAAIIGSHAGKGEVEVYVDRELKAGQLYTISLPFAVANADGLFGSGTVVYEYADLKYENDEYALYFDNTKNAMEAGKPYLVQPGSDINGFEYNNADVVFEQKVISKTLNNTTISMESVLSVTAGATTNGKYWLASDNCLYNVCTALKSLRAVFDIQSTKANVRARVAFGENVETGVDNIVTTDTPVKVIKNGQLIIIREGVKYNVQGQKL